MPDSSGSRSGTNNNEGAFALWIGGVGAFSLAYAALRYNVFKGVPWEHFPLYVVNKAAALSAAALLASSYLIGKWPGPPPGHEESRPMLGKFLGLAGFTLAVMHSVMSIALWSPDYYEKFFGGGKMNLTGELMMLFGVLAILLMASPAVSSLPAMREALGMRWWLRSQRTGYLALALAALHTLVMGYSGWLVPAEWPGKMPPITLLGFLVIVAPLVTRAVRGKNRRQRDHSSPTELH